MKTETTAELWHLCRPEVSRKEYNFVSYGFEKQSKTSQVVILVPSILS